MQISSIPKSLAPFLGEYMLSDLDPETNAASIIECTLQYGNLTEIRWLFEMYTRPQLRAWLLRNGVERLPEPHITFWKFLLGV